MIDSFNNLIACLRNYLLNNTKPGERAQKIMMPEGRIMTPGHLQMPKPSAVLIALYEHQNEIYFPIIRRPEYNGMHSGQMAFPGGKPEKSDVDLIYTALRECEEEIGISAKLVKIIGTLTELYIPVTNMQILPVLGYLDEIPKMVTDPFEVDALFQIKISDLLNPASKSKETWNLRGANTEVPFYNFYNQKVWGATAMILSELEQIIMHNISNLAAKKKTT